MGRYSDLPILQPVGEGEALQLGVPPIPSYPIESPYEEKKDYSGMKILEPPSPENKVYDPERKSLLGKIFDYTLRTQYMSANITWDLLQNLEEAKSYPEVAKQFEGKPLAEITWALGHADLDTAQAAWRGLTGEQKGDYIDILKHYNVPAAPVFGFILDIGADPLTWVPTKPLYTLGGKLISKIPGASKLGKAVANSTPIGKIKRLFSARGTLPKEYYEFKLLSKYKLGAKEKQVIDLVDEAAKVTTPRMRKLISYQKSHPYTYMELPPEAQKVLIQGSDILSDLLDDLVKHGDISTEAANKMRISYLPGYYDEIYSYYRGGIPPDFFAKVAKPGFLKHKQFASVFEAKQFADDILELVDANNLDDMLEMARKFDLEKNLEYFKLIKDEFVPAGQTRLDMAKNWIKQKSKVYASGETDWLKILARRVIDQERFFAKEKFMDEALEQFGQKIPLKMAKVAPEGYGIYLRKNKIRFYQLEYIAKSELAKFRLSIKDLKLAKGGENIKRITRRYKMTPKQAAKPYETMKRIVKESLESRGFTEGEALNMINRMEVKGAAGLKEVMEEVVEETTRFDPTQLLGKDIISLPEIRRTVAVTGKVPVYMLPKEIADDMNKVSKFFWGSPSNEAWRFFDRLHGIWKTQATAMRLPFHLRNMYSNYGQVIICGDVNPVILPQRIRQAAQIAMGKEGALASRKVGKLTFKLLRKEIDDLGIRGRGWLGMDIPHWASEEIDWILKGKTKYLNVPKLASRYGRKFGTIIEDNARIALYIDQRLKGFSPEDASRMVRKVLFNYDELSEFERVWMKRAIPFYTWTRKNIPLQINTILTKPGKWNWNPKLMNMLGSFSAETRAEREYKPEYFSEMIYRKSPFTDPKTGHPLYYHIDLPYEDITRFVKTGEKWNEWMDVQELLSGMNPFIKLGIELTTKKKLFPLGAEIGGKRPYVPAPFYVMWLPELIQSKLGVQKIRDHKTGKWIVGMPAWLRHSMDSMFPALSEMGKMHPQPLTLEAEQEPWRIASYFTGIKITPLNIEQQKFYHAIEKQGKAEELFYKLRQLGRPPTTEELKEILED